jgi:hypothetical protein
LRGVRCCGTRNGEQAELEQRRDCDEIESIWTQQEIALWRWIEIREAFAESAAAPA